MKTSGNLVLAETTDEGVAARRIIEATLGGLLLHVRSGPALSSPVLR